MDSEFIPDLSNQLGYISDTYRIQKRLTEILGNDDHCVFVAVESEMLVGWIHGFYSLRVESDPFVEIGGLVVDENHRKHGIGKMLVEKILEWAALKACQKVRVRCNTVRTDSHLFYQQLGFEVQKEQKVLDKLLLTRVKSI